MQSMRTSGQPRARARGRTRALVIAAATATALVALAAPAWAHITVNPDTAQAGSATELTFRVPNEEAKANVSQVQVQIPTDHPIAQLLAKPVAGWTVTIKPVTLARPVTTDDGTFSTAVSEVTWAGGTITPGQFQDFSVSADPLPEGVTQVTFKAIATYSNGDVVRWIDLPQAGQPAPDHPAPVLTLTAASAAQPGAAGTSAPSQPGTTATAGNDTTGISLGVAGLAAGLLGLAAGLAAWRRARGPARGMSVLSQPTEDASSETSSR